MVEEKYSPKEDFKEDIDWANDGYAYFYGHIEQEKEITKHKIKTA